MVGPFTPTIRGYTQATSLQSTDAIEIDRIGTGTMWISGLNCGNGLYAMIQATLASGATDNWAPTGYVANVDAIQVTTNAAGSTLDGLTAGFADRKMILANAGPAYLTIAHNASGTAANGFYCPNGVDIVIAPNGALAFVYDAFSHRWRAIEGSSSAATAVFRVGTATNQHLSAPRGYLNNGGHIVTFDSDGLVDPSGGVTLSFNMSALPGCGPADTYYSPFTVYQIPVTGLWCFTAQQWVGILVGAVNPQMTVEVVHWNSTGARIFDNVPLVSEFQSEGPVWTLPSGGSPLNVTAAQTIMLQCTAGDYVASAFLGGDNSQTMDLFGGNTYFFGYLVR